MRVLSLEARDFRAYESENWELGPRVHISGDNGQGKSSVAELIVYALFGTTMTGSPQTDHLLRKGAKDSKVAIEFGTDQVYRIDRTLGRKKKVYINGQEASQTDVDHIIGAKDQFLAVFAPAYFVSLDNKSARDMLMKLVKVPSKVDVLAKMDKPFAELLAGIDLLDPEEVAKDLRREIKECEAAYNRAEGRIEELKSRLAREIPEVRKFDVRAMDALRTRIQQGTSLMAQELASLRTEHQNLRPQYERLKKQLTPLPSEPYQDGDPCDTCGQALHGQHLVQALAKHRDLVDNLQERNDRIKTDMLALVERGKVVATKIEELESKQEGDLVASLREELAAMEVEWREVEAHNAHANRLRIDHAEDEGSLQKVEQELKDLKTEQFQLGEQVKAVGQYRATLADMQISQLKQHLNKVDIKLFDVTKSTGEVKPTFELLYEVREFKSLSYSEQIRVHLEIATLFNKVTGMDYPVFIDNAESITWYEEPVASQVFTARVEEGQELRVETIEAKAKGDVA